ncbi:hypothetical protein OTK49_28270 [Vibrio coralliirubri]|uniref:hypothetical protein n=1 Tax=Vibrio coralliirubri TaxID=1516159 RepID=UPI0022849754|nr:hypothetical protein [Vibrio coralliirubri]MCY9866439.1 hypothetical protein [Vibrio coralliirubri]
MKMLNEQAKEFLKEKLSEKDILKFTKNNFALPSVVTKELEGLIPELKDNELYDVLVKVSDGSFLVRFICMGDINIDNVVIPKDTQPSAEIAFSDETMQRIRIDANISAIKYFEAGIPLCINFGKDQYHRITTVDDLLRYMYSVSIFTPKTELQNFRTIALKEA